MVSAYYELNRERILEKSKQWRENNKDKIEKQKEKIKCECGSIISRSGVSGHKNTDKHLRFNRLLKFYNDKKVKNKKWIIEALKIDYNYKFE